MRSTWLRGLLLALALLAIAIVTLPPAPGQPSAVWLDCLMCGDSGTAGFLLNVLLFVPLGVALAAWGCSTARSAASGLLLSALIEVAQLYIPGRDFSVGDIAANLLGAALGAALLRSLHSWLAPDARRATRLSRAASVVAATLCLATGALLEPAFPLTRAHGMWTPFFGHLERYRGRVLDVTLNGTPIASNVIPDWPYVRSLLLADSGFSLEVRAIAGPRPSALAPLFAIYNDDRREMLLLGVGRDDLILRLRTHAAAAHLDRPDIRVPNVLRGFQRGDSLDIAVTRRSGGDYLVAVNDSLAAGARGFSVGSGWALLLYSDALPYWLEAALTVAWTGILFVPAAYWMRTRADAAWIGGGVLAGLLGAPALTVLVTTPVAQWLAIAVGLAIGRGAHVVTAAASARTQRSIRE